MLCEYLPNNSNAQIALSHNNPYCTDYLCKEINIITNKISGSRVLKEEVCNSRYNVYEWVRVIALSVGILYEAFGYVNGLVDQWIAVHGLLFFDSSNHLFLAITKNAHAHVH